ncbi:MFS transporter [Cupriavidus cauae]|uniref:MFS transporter n=1 Tax=Cupriavidus cauae TaxID=2608999 RepID=UPI002244D296|nr:MFS transporter [Cupriavidus cauae]UZN50000.1 MFS transporter [Cupriavidus cauae]
MRPRTGSRSNRIGLSMRPSSLLRRSEGALVFACFAAAYVLSYALRTINAVIAPELIADMRLSNADLGLLSSAYFLAFAAMQLPVGQWLDRRGVRRVETVLLLIAAAGALVFALAGSAATLWLGRALIGAGVSACLMASYTAYRRWFPTARQSQLSVWMLVAGSGGALMTTLPVQAVLPWLGWRGVFLVMAGLLLVSALALYRGLARVERRSVRLARGAERGRTVADPADIAADIATASATVSATGSGAGSATDGMTDGATNSVGSPTNGVDRATAAAKVPAATMAGGYRALLRHPAFVRVLPFGLLNQAGFMAVQTLWVGPWLVDVLGFGPDRTAQILFLFNIALLAGYLLLGWLAPRRARDPVESARLVMVGAGLTLVLQAAIVAWTAPAAWLLWPLLAMCASTLSLILSTLSLSFPAAVAGRANTTYNLLVFGGSFLIQWGLGVAIDLFRDAGLPQADAFRAALGGLLGLQLVGYLWYALVPRLWRRVAG